MAMVMRVFKSRLKFRNQFPNNMAFSRLLIALFFAAIFSLTISSADSVENVWIFYSLAPCNSEVCLQALEPVQLVAPDGSVRANFIRYGATVTNFCVKDKVRSWFYQSCPFYT